jgi:hypothetical protein
MKNIFISVLLLTAFASCKKEDSTDVVKGLPNMGDFLGLTNAKKNGGINLSSQKAFDISSNTGQRGLVLVNGKFWNDNLVTQNYGVLSIDSFTLVPGSDGRYQSDFSNKADLKGLFGKTVTFQVDKGDAERTVVLQSGFYVPVDIIVSSPIKTAQNQVLQQSTLITWNQDAQNTKGVYILIEFDPEDEENAAFNNGIRTYRYNLIQTDDDGAFALSPNDFSDMPAGATISLWIGRSNYEMIDGADGINQYAIRAYTFARDVFILGR